MSQPSLKRARAINRIAGSVGSALMWAYLLVREIAHVLASLR